jgi:hypothetical protein
MMMMMMRILTSSRRGGVAEEEEEASWKTIKRLSFSFSRMDYRTAAAVDSVLGCAALLGDRYPCRRCERRGWAASTTADREIAQFGDKNSSLPSGGKICVQPMRWDDFFRVDHRSERQRSAVSR